MTAMAEISRAIGLAHVSCLAPKETTGNPLQLRSRFADRGHGRMRERRSGTRITVLVFMLASPSPEEDRVPTAH
jgi:hypothetical protein